MISEETREKWDDKIAFLMEGADRLNDWEADFIDSLDSWRSENKDLTHKQSKVLNKIFEGYVR